MPTGLLQHIDWIKYGIELVGISEKPSCACDAADKFKPDIIIIDKKLPPLSLLVLVNQLFLGNTSNLCELLKLAEDVDCAKKILTTQHRTRITGYTPEIIILFDYKDYVYAPQALSLGASACVMKPYTVHELIGIIQNSKEAINIKEQKLRSVGKNNVFDILIKKTMKYIQANYKENIGLTDISSAFYLSPNYLCMLFKKDTGISLNNYMQKIRIEQARRILLEDDSVQIPDIARSVGFNDDKYFYGVFKKYMYLTPNKYRKIYKASDKP